MLEVPLRLAHAHHRLLQALLKCRRGILDPLNHPHVKRGEQRGRIAHQNARLRWVS